jgi:histidinol-phosphate/aromatic aminotransferase/cobyric acid decarboxylase-like protein
MPAARKTGLPIKLVSYSGKVTDLQKMKEAIDANTKCIYQPHNPTGTIIPAAELNHSLKR